MDSEGGGRGLMEGGVMEGWRDGGGKEWSRVRVSEGGGMVWCDGGGGEAVMGYSLYVGGRLRTRTVGQAVVSVCEWLSSYVGGRWSYSC